MIRPQPSSADRYYEIRIQGELAGQWTSWFNGSAIASEISKGSLPITVLTVRVPDQARLRGILNKIWDLNLTLISVMYIPEKAARTSLSTQRDWDTDRTDQTD